MHSFWQRFQENPGNFGLTEHGKRMFIAAIVLAVVTWVLIMSIYG